ncbi:MAG TPA: Fic family protein [Longimicrobium sp.]|nr:Fic family protein [Longimicrobium sp.]
MNDIRGRPLPEPAQLAGYAELIETYGLRVPLPPRLAAISARHHPPQHPDWLLLTPRHAPAPTLRGSLEFALKWEGVDLGVLAALFKVVPESAVAAVVREAPTGIYTRRVWFLYEWLTGCELDVPPAGKVKSVPAVDPEQQFALSNGRTSSRHRVVDNLPGTRSFCPMVRRTAALAALQERRLDVEARQVIGRTHPDVVARAAAFLLLDDSRSSFEIEGERPPSDRTARWAQAIAQAGSRPLSVAELERLQKIVIGDARFVTLGLRETGGFIGEHDRFSRYPIPVHVSARAADLPDLVAGIAAYDERAVQGGVDPVVAAAVEAFGIVYVHPFEDGNGRLHRWLIHHVLSKAGYNPPGLVFPVSAAILRDIDTYRAVLESYSALLLPLIQWRGTDESNVEVLNETGDYYRYFDATLHAEFLYRCVEQTVKVDLPGEVRFLESYDRFSGAVQALFDMPRSRVDLLHRFLRQGNGLLSRRARSREFAGLEDAEVARIEQLHAESFQGDARQP